jgi:hypothetical protein
MGLSHSEFDADAEAPSEADIARFSDDTLRCHECGAMLYAGVDLCAKCGAVQFHETDVRGMRNPLLRHPWLLTLVIVVVLLAFALLVL